VETPGDPLPDEITLSREEARQVLFAMDDALEAIPATSALHQTLQAAARLIVEKFLPDLPEL